MIRSVHLGFVSPALIVLAGIATVGCGDGEARPASGVELVFGRTGLGPSEFSYPRAAVLSSDQHI